MDREEALEVLKEVLEGLTTKGSQPAPSQPQQQLPLCPPNNVSFEVVEFVLDRESKLRQEMRAHEHALLEKLDDNTEDIADHKETGGGFGAKINLNTIKDWILLSGMGGLVSFQAAGSVGAF